MNKLERIDGNEELRAQITPVCRLQQGEVWEDPEKGHRIGCLDATDRKGLSKLLGTQKGHLAIQDPPYNLIVGNRINSGQLGRIKLCDFIAQCRFWIGNTLNYLHQDSHLYVWMGVGQKQNFQPLADFIKLMEEFPEFKSRSFITLRNQRGYGTQRNWMAVRQELLNYVKGEPIFNIDAVYTEIPKILKGYYKEVHGKRTENTERGKSPFIRAGNVWVDIQQVFYRMEENVPGCYAQKPLKAIERIIKVSSRPGDTILDFFAHSGTTLIGAERTGRKCFTIDKDPVFAEITIRRLENFRKTGKTGWQFDHPFDELSGNS